MDITSTSSPLLPLTKKIFKALSLTIKLDTLVAWMPFSTNFSLSFSIELEINAKDWIALQIRGNIFREQTEYELAEKSYLRALEINDNDVDIYYNLGDLQAIQEKFEKALEYFLTAEQLATEDDFDVIFCIASVYDQMENNDLAIKYYRKVVEIAPSAYMIFIRLADLYYEREEFIEAKYCINEALKQTPEDAKLWNNLGILDLKLGYPKEAAKSVEKSLELDDKDPNTWDTLGEIFVELEDYKTALEYYEKAVELAPDEESYKQDLENLKKKMEQ